MANELDKNQQKEQKEKVQDLEKVMKLAFKEGDFDEVYSVSDKLKVLDPENHLSQKLIEKVENTRKKQKVEAKKAKIKEYEGMLKKLFKDGELDKLLALAKELKEFDSENKAVDKWTVKAQKLKGKAEQAKEVSKANLIDKKPGFFAKLLSKPKNNLKIEVSPTSTPAPAPTPTPTPTPTSIPVVPKVAAPLIQKPATPVIPVKPVINVPPKGNLFTNMFKKGEEDKQTEKSIIDTIVAKTDEKKVQKIAKQKPVKLKKKKEKVKINLLSFSKVFINFTAIFIVFSAAFLYVEFLDEENTMLSLVGIQENTGSRLRSSAEENRSNKRKEAVLSKDIQLYKSGYQDKAMDTVNKIIDDRINWPDIFSKINRVTDSIYELNDFFKYIEYNNYSFDAERGTIRVTGTLSDPVGRNLTRLVELEEAFMYFPKDKNNPNDDTEPFFSDFKEFTSFSKTIDPETGRYTSSFQLSFALNK